jgi:hypothetical protein
MSKPRMRHCFFCGEELGVHAYADPYDTCGKPECDREAANTQQQEREDAHRDLDELMGWNR